jgi:4'-phosphopantetheinyl transferase
MATCIETPARTELDLGLVDVYWLELTDPEVPADNDWVSPGEHALLQAMRFPTRRNEWRLGRWTAKSAVSAYLNNRRGALEFSNLEIRAAASGAPEVFIGENPAPLNISISHRDGRAVCAVTCCGVALGCDLETVEPRSDAFSSDYFTRAEQELFAGAPASDRSRLVTLLWSAKESALKALDAGLRLDTRSVVVRLGKEPQHLAQQEWHPLAVLHDETSVFHGWWQCQCGFVRTLVAAPPPSPPKFLRR